MRAMDDVIREKLREYAEQHRLSPRAWARQAGLGETTLVEFLRGGSRSITVSTLAKLARARDRSLVEFLLEIEVERAPAMPTVGAEPGLAHSVAVALHWGELRRLMEKIEASQRATNEAVWSITDELRAERDRRRGRPAKARAKAAAAVGGGHNDTA